MIERYSLSPMRELWTEEAKYRRWLQVEQAVAAAQAELEIIPQSAAATIQGQAHIDAGLIARAKEIEARIGHDFLAFVRALEEQLGPEGRYLHFGLTSSDVIDTAQALALRDGLDILLGELHRLMHVVLTRAVEHKHTLMVGRTHGMHAEPITFGLKLLNWHYELERDVARLEQAREAVAYGKISGSVGTYAHLEPEVEARVCARLGLKPAKISNQVIQRDRYAQALAALAILGAGLERIAVEIRNLNRTEIAEVREGRPHGSSSMPHKRNPIACETITGLARLLRANLLAALEDIALWHERDISHSSVERVILPDSFLIAHYMLRRLRSVLENLHVDPQRMRANLELTGGLICSQAVLLQLIKKGMSRTAAHELLQNLAIEAQRTGRPFKTVLAENDEIKKYLTPQELEEAFDYSYYTRYVDQIFQRFRS